MPIKVLELHHHAVRVPQAKAEEVARFYEDVLGLPRDKGRPHIPAVPGSWHFIGPEDGPTTQIHIMGADGVSGIAKASDQDPTKFHVALAVEDVQEARQELDRMGTPYWVAGEAVGIVQLFVHDPAGNMIELHQAGTCNCNRIGAPASVSMA
jgi:catechol 2,3-dioxygenase-like lactoylglutathione lyase family enzyme